MGFMVSTGSRSVFRWSGIRPGGKCPGERGDLRALEIPNQGLRRVSSYLGQVKEFSSFDSVYPVDLVGVGQGVDDLRQKQFKCVFKPRCFW